MHDTKYASGLLCTPPYYVGELMCMLFESEHVFKCGKVVHFPSRDNGSPSGIVAVGTKLLLALENVPEDSPFIFV